MLALGCRDHSKSCMVGWRKKKKNKVTLAHASVHCTFWVEAEAQEEEMDGQEQP